MCVNDPLVYNELGVCAYRELHYDDAVHYFQKALSFVSLVSYHVVSTCTMRLSMNDIDIGWYGIMGRYVGELGSCTAQTVALR